MPDLYPPSTDRNDRRLQRLMESLVHDTVRTDPDSRHYHAANPLKTELDHTLASVRRLDPRPWSADVRQTAAVAPAQPDTPEVRTEDFLYGVPADIELRELRRYETGGASFRDHKGLKPALSGVRAAETNGGLIVQSGRTYYKLQGVGDTDTIHENTDGVLMSDSPGSWLRGQGRSDIGGEVAVQVNGLEVQFAGRGTFELDVEFTGVASVTDGDDLSALTGFAEPLNLYDDNGDKTPYTTSADTISISDTGAHTLYYRGLWSKSYKARNTTRLDQVPGHALSLVPIAESLHDVPSPQEITCTQKRSVLVRTLLEDGEVDVSTGGYVGSTYAGHRIHHALSGSHYVLALGGGMLSVAEPAAARTAASYGVPENSVGLTWTTEGALGLIVAEGPDLVVYAINEIRQGQQGGLAPKPTIPYG